MSRIPINVGTSANDGTGDPLRTAGQSINAMTLELYAFSGAVQGLTAGSSAAAAANVTAINSALASGGFVNITKPGVYSINDTLVINSNTSFLIGKGVELQMVTGGPSAGVCYNAMHNANYQSIPIALTSITAATYSHFMVQATVTFASAHGLVAGKYVQIKGDARNIYNGIWRVFSAPSGTTLTFLMSIASSTLAPPSTCTAVASASQTVATPGLFTTAANTFVPGQAVSISGAAPGGFVLGKTYYVINTGLTTTAVQLADSPTATTGKQVTSSASCTLTPVLQGSPADANIWIGGGGRINANFQAGGFTNTSDVRDHGIILRRVLNPVVDDIYFEDVRKYCILMQDVWNPRVSNMDAHTGSDGVHFHGPCINPLAENITGTYGDDVVIFQPIDFYIGYPFMVGGLAQMSIGTASFAGVFDLGGDMFNGTMRNIRPRHNHNSSACTLYPNSNSGNTIGSHPEFDATSPIYAHLGTITIDGASMEDPQDVDGTNWKPNNTLVIGGSYVTVASTIENVVIKNIHGYMRFDNSGGGVAITINKATIDGWNLSSQRYYDNISTGSYVNGLYCDWHTINHLTVSNVNAVAYQGETVVGFASANVSVDLVDLRDVNLDQMNSGVQAPILLSSIGATVGIANFNGCRLGPGASLTGNSTYANTPLLMIAGCKGMSGFKNFIENSGTQAMKVFIDACTGISPSAGGIINSYGSAVMNVYVSRYFDGGSSPIFATYSSGNGITYTNPDGTGPVDLTLIARGAGSVAKHNGGHAAGTIVTNNLAVCDATNVANSWKQLSNTSLVY